MKITMIIPKTEPRPFAMFNVPAYGAVLVATVLKNQGHDVTVIDEQLRKIKIKDLKDTDVLLVSATTSTVDRGYFIAKEFKKLTGKPVIFGGIHISCVPEEALDNGGDIVVTGEAEITIIELIKNLDKILKLPKEKRIIQGELVKDLDSLPFPDYSLVQGFKPGIVFPKSVSVVPVMPFRGCINRCPFCASWKVGGLRCRSPENFKKELEYLLNQGFKVFYFGSDYFSWSKLKSREILNVMKSINFKERSQGAMIQDSVKMAFDKDGNIDHEYLELMKEAGVSMIALGIESLSEKSFKDFTKETGKKQTTLQSLEALKAIKQHGMNPYSFLMAGADNQSAEEILESAKIANKFGAGQMPILTPFPGTQLFEDLKKQKRLLVYGPGYWKYYDALNVVFKHPTMSAKEIREATYKAWRVFYNYGMAIKFFLKGIGNMFILNGDGVIYNIVRIFPAVIGEKTARQVRNGKIKPFSQTLSSRILK